MTSMLVGKWFSTIDGSGSLGWESFKVLEIGPGHVVIRFAVGQHNVLPALRVIPLSELAKVLIVEVPAASYDTWRDEENV